MPRGNLLPTVYSICLLTAISNIRASDVTPVQLRTAVASRIDTKSMLQLRGKAPAKNGAAVACIADEEPPLLHYRSSARGSKLDKPFCATGSTVHGQAFCVCQGVALLGPATL
jgi:hypothetical protein